MSEVLQPLEITISGGQWSPSSPDAIEKGSSLGTYLMPIRRHIEADLITTKQTNFNLRPDLIIEELVTTTITSRRYPSVSDTWNSDPYQLGHGEVIEVIDPKTRQVSYSLKIIYDIPFISKRTSEPFE